MRESYTSHVVSPDTLREAREFRVFGPPGCGKTTYLVSEIRRLVLDKGPNCVAIASFSRTGAQEIRSRVEIDLASYGLKIPDARCKTVHGLAYSTIRGSDGATEIAEVGKLADEWNRINTADPASMIPVRKDKVEDLATHDLMTVVKGAGEHLANYSRIRNLQLADLKMDPAWSPEFQLWVDRWEAFKEENDAVDFTDMIVRAYALDPEIRYLFVDEAQDLTPLEAQTVRTWGQELDLLILSGDDDQSIYSFRGGRPDVMLTPHIDKSMKKILGQSYRLPSVIKEFAEGYVKANVRLRETKEFEPRVEGGYIEALVTNYEEAQRIANRIEVEEKRGSVMVLTSCRYMLDQILTCLKLRGVLFRNPYQPKMGRWNSSNNAILSRLCEYLKALPCEGEPVARWTWKCIAKFTEFWEASKIKELSGGLFKKTDFKSEGTSKETASNIVGIGDFAMMLNMNASELTPEFFFEMLMPSKKKASTFARAAFARYGYGIVNARPRICPGTIHSVKGAEADTVILFPDISKASAEDDHPDMADNLARLFYVGMTRAKKQLLLGSPKNQKHAVDFALIGDKGRGAPEPLPAETPF